MLRAQDRKRKGISGADGTTSLPRDSLAETTTKALSWPAPRALPCLCLGAPCLCGCSFRLSAGLPISNTLFLYRV